VLPESGTNFEADGRAESATAEQGSTELPVIQLNPSVGTGPNKG
jgi:hypothetical protein